jgi:hypothetical protein
MTPEGEILACAAHFLVMFLRFAWTWGATFAPVLSAPKRKMFLSAEKILSLQIVARSFTLC